jgi:hypothetical protein
MIYTIAEWKSKVEKKITVKGSKTRTVVEEVPSFHLIDNRTNSVIASSFSRIEILTKKRNLEETHAKTLGVFA